MSVLNYVTSILFSIAATSGTYLVMHMVVAPRLPAISVDVPAVQGLTPEQARAILDPRGLLLVIEGEKVPESDRIQPGSLFDQRPLGGSRVRPGEKIMVTLARAMQTVRVPQLTGQLEAEARQKLEQAGLKAGTLTEEVSDAVAPGRIVRTQPEGGAEVRPDTPVNLFVSKVIELVAVPNLRGRSVRSAKQALEQNGLALGEQQRGVDDNMDDGVILRQNPLAGAKVPKGSKVDLVVNN